MKHFYNYLVYIIFSISLIILFSCDNIIDRAFSKNIENIPLSPPGNFVSVVGDNSVLLSWINPADSNFDKAVLLRKTGSYPDSYYDTYAKTVYQGNAASYEDTSVNSGETYYYALYSVNTKGYYSDHPAISVKTIASLSAEIRFRCFYLIGGSTSYSDTFNNLVSEIDLFDPVTNTVYQNAISLPRVRYSCAAASANGKIYIFGGLDENQDTIKEIDILDVQSPTWPNNIWSTGTDMPLPRYSLRAENLEGDIYVFGGSTSIAIPFAAMSDYNHKYNPVTNRWITDESKVPRLAYKFMNFGCGSFGSTLIYGVGRYNGAAGFSRYIRVHNISANFSVNVNDADLAVTASNASLLYHRVTATNTDLYAYMIIGGCTDNNTYYEPLLQTTGSELNAISSCFYMQMPMATLNVADTGQGLNTARAYAEAEYYGDNIYIFCGLTDQSTQVQSTYEILTMDDALSFSTSWSLQTNTGLNPRFAFEIVKVQL